MYTVQYIIYSVYIYGYELKNNILNLTHNINICFNCNILTSYSINAVKI